LASDHNLSASDAATAPLNTVTPQFVGKIEATKMALQQAQPPAADSQTPTYLRDVLPILMGKCGRCHNDQTHVMSNWLDYKTAAARRWEIKRRIWDSWKGAYFKQPMPIANSTESEAITDEERTTIRNWVQSGAPCGVRPAFNSAQSTAERIELGKRLFATICAACHQPTGQGIAGRFPPLAGSDFLNSDKHRAIKVVINGLQGEVTVNGQKFNNSMPRFPLTDEDIANALTYVYNSFGNSRKEVSPEEVNAARAEKEDVNLAGQGPSPKAPEEKSPFE
jgi:mono/diheme cytochrome c family protein